MNDSYAVPDALLARCGGRVDLVQRVIGVFVEQVRSDLSQLEEEIRNGKAEEASKLAHRIKGASANVCAEEMRIHAERIERLTHEERLNETSDPLVELKSNLQVYSELTSTFLA